MPTHTRIRMFNTKQTYPNQALDNDLCQAVRAGNTIYVRGQIGTDFDGDGGVPGLANASELIQLTRRLQAEGFTDEDLAKIWGGNFLRVMTRVQAAAQG